jgi:SAM-dependent MidA family methyltransferase
MTALAELPAVAVTGVVLANELLDNLPVDVVELRHGAWQELRVAAAEPDGAELAEVLVPARPDVVAEVERLVGGSHPGAATALPEGARVPLPRAAAAWVRRAIGQVERGRVVVIDYGDSTMALAGRPWRSWLRTYRGHRPGGPPTEGPGSQDITCEVAVDQLVEAAGRPALERTQAQFLRTHGIEQLRAEAAEAWKRRAHVGDLEALRWRSRVHEADALCDPEGLGAFRVLEWALGGAG